MYSFWESEAPRLEDTDLKRPLPIMKYFDV